MSARIIVKGRVQMVGYRYFTMRKAAFLGVKGYVRNMSNGDVEIVADAEQKVLEEFMYILREGPAGANVKDLVVQCCSDDKETFTDFTVRY